ncbi:hypothetical protein [Oceanobacillus sp. FSL W7-1281]|uniref:hypothetical protein n=1 Tax=Oceanobacillus sp. FSL W7-1281 TaxID=2921698 RepID=UPI0030D7755C
MNFNLLKNGIDSLKQAENSIDENYMNYEFESFQLKDGLFNFIHGFEILSKYIIRKNNEEGIIKNKFIRRFRIAKDKEFSMGKNALEIDEGIQTISVSDALDILYSEYRLNDNLFNNVKYLIKKRNSLMHYTIEMNEGEKDDFVQILRETIEMSIDYFNELSWEFKHSFLEHEREFPFTEFDEWEQKAIDADESRNEEDYIEYLIEEGIKHLK